MNKKEFMKNITDLRIDIKNLDIRKDLKAYLDGHLFQFEIDFGKVLDNLINSAKEDCAKIAEKDYNTIRLLKRDEEIRPIFKKSGDFIAKAIRDTI